MIGPEPLPGAPMSSLSLASWWQTIGASGVLLVAMAGGPRRLFEWAAQLLGLAAGAADKRDQRLDAKAMSIIDQGQENAAALLKRAQDAEAECKVQREWGMHWREKASDYRSTASEYRHALRTALSCRDMGLAEFNEQYPPLPPLESDKP